MDIVEYFNEKDELEIKEKRLFEIIDIIDKESFKLFCEVVDLDLNSYYKADNFCIRINNLTNMLEQLSNCYYYLLDLEANRMISIRKRIITQRLLVAIASTITMFVNVFAGLANFIILNSIVDKSLFKEIELLSKKFESIDEIDLSTIGITLENAANLLKGKMNRLYAMEENEELSQNVIIANNYISSYLADDLSNEELETLPSDSKQMIVKILQKDLDSKSNDIYELLSKLRIKNDSEIKLVKELN